MFLRQLSVPLAAIVLAALADAQSSTVDFNSYPPQPQATACGDIVRANLYGDLQSVFNASDIFDCFTSVPFDGAVALRFLKYLNQTLQYHATTAYLRDPPAAYQQPAFDLFASIGDIVDRVNNNAYHNQYAFEVEVQGLVRGLHDQHAYIYGGINSLASFISPYRLVSVSPDGRQSPQLYVYDDLIDQVTNGAPNASVISTINGVDAVQYVASFAQQQSFGMVEPNADWNQLMNSPAQELFGLNSFSDAATFYAGDQLSLTFANGTTVEDRWLALYFSPGFTGPLETGGDFYNFFVIGNLPANYEEQYDIYYNGSLPDDPSLSAGDDVGGSLSNLTSWHDNSTAYPSDTISFQQDLGLLSPGALTGYYLAESSTAVLSLPSFEQYGDGIDTFSQAVIDFIDNATQRQAQRVIIDLQQNDGGLAALAFHVFDLFFPNIRPFAGSRMRSHRDADIVGDAFTSYFATLSGDPDDDEVQNYEDSEWTVTDRINAQTSANFTSWSQYYGPQNYNGDQFSLVQQYDLSNPTFVEAALGIYLPDCYYTQSCDRTPLWDPADIVILTDGACASTCSLFVEMMRQQGVRSVAIGGLPQQGPMQAAGGTRGAAAYSDDELYSDYDTLQDINATAAAHFPPADTGIYGVSIGFTLRDQIRRNETIPNQVLYLPADCRLYWTLNNFYNYTRLWQDVHDATFTDPSLCVPGSRNAQAPTPIAPSPNTTGLGVVEYILNGLSTAAPDRPSTNGSIPFSGVRADGSQPFPTVCDFNNKDPNQCKQRDYRCLQVQFPCAACTDGSCSAPASVGICSKSCVNGDNNGCPGGVSQCKSTAFIATRNNASPGLGTQTRGYCDPIWTQTNRKKRCNQITSQTLPGLINRDEEYSDAFWIEEEDDESVDA